MTKKDFIAIADVLDANLASLEMVEDMADVLEETNPRFDRKRFIAASTLSLIERTEVLAERLANSHGRV